MMLGSIPQQDVFQRVMSANTERAATHGTVIGGTAYIFFAFVPMFLVASALLIMPQETAELLKDDPQKVLPTLVMDKMPLVMQVLFFGALLSAIKSCASATLLAPSVTFTPNIWRQFRPEKISDRENLLAMRIVCWCSRWVCWPHQMEGTAPFTSWCPAPTKCRWWGRCVPLVFGLYWKRANTQGALCAVVLGIGVWLVFMVTPALHEAFPATRRPAGSHGRHGGRFACAAGGAQFPCAAPPGGGGGVTHECAVRRRVHAYN